MSGPLFLPDPFADYGHSPLTVSITRGQTPFLEYGENANNVTDKTRDDATYGADLEVIDFLGRAMNFEPKYSNQ